MPSQPWTGRTGNNRLRHGFAICIPIRTIRTSAPDAPSSPPPNRHGCKSAGRGCQGGTANRSIHTLLARPSQSVVSGRRERRSGLNSIPHPPACRAASARHIQRKAWRHWPRLALCVPAACDQRHCIFPNSRSGWLWMSAEARCRNRRTVPATSSGEDQLLHSSIAANNIGGRSG